MTHIAYSAVELNWQPIPVKLQQMLLWRIRRVEALHPVAGVQGVHGSPGFVPVTGEPHVIVIRFIIWAEKPSCSTALI